jgi:hypothetical protein
MMCGSCSNENAFKLMHFKHMEKERGGREFTQEERDSCMVNQAGGAMTSSFQNAFPQDEDFAMSRPPKLQRFYILLLVKIYFVKIFISEPSLLFHKFSYS